MPDLRDDLDRLADRAGEPASFNDLANARRRRERRRRAEGLVVGLAVIVAAAVFLATTFRSGSSADVPGGPPATAYVPPETPYLWPENWVFSSDTPADVQAKVDAGDPDLQWQTDPQQVVERFAAEVLGWDGIDIGGQESATGQQFWEFGPACSDPSRCPSVSNEKVSIAQPVRVGEGGIWEVQRVAGADLGFSPQEPGMHSSLEPGATLVVDNSLPGSPDVAAGTSAANGCITLGGTAAIGQVATFSVNGVGGSADRAGNCGALFAAFAYVYAVVDGMPDGYPLTENSPMQELTMVPFVVDANAIVPPTSSPVAGTQCTSTPLTNVTIVGQNIALDGCGSWAAGEPIEIKFDVRDDGIPMGLQLFPASACDVNGCSGKPVWTGDIIVGSNTTTYQLNALDAGSYVLLDPVHPFARLEITVG